MSRYYVREIERDWQPIEAENVEAAAERYVAEYTEPADGSNYWIDLVVARAGGRVLFPPNGEGFGRGVTRPPPRRHRAVPDSYRFAAGRSDCGAGNRTPHSTLFVAHSTPAHREGDVNRSGKRVRH